MVRYKYKKETIRSCILSFFYFILINKQQLKTVPSYNRRYTCGLYLYEPILANISIHNMTCGSDIDAPKIRMNC